MYKLVCVIMAVFAAICLCVFAYAASVVVTAARASETATVGQVGEVELVDASAHSPPHFSDDGGCLIVRSFEAPVHRTISVDYVSGCCSCDLCKSKLQNTMIDINTDDRNVLDADQLAKFPVHLYVSTDVTDDVSDSPFAHLSSPLGSSSITRGRRSLVSDILKCPTEAAGFGVPC